MNEDQIRDQGSAVRRPGTRVGRVRVQLQVLYTPTQYCHVPRGLRPVHRFQKRWQPLFYEAIRTIALCIAASERAVGLLWAIVGYRELPWAIVGLGRANANSSAQTQGSTLLLAAAAP